jgi:DNA-directed RNA polymerase II subunit RPB1
MFDDVLRNPQLKHKLDREFSIIKQDRDNYRDIFMNVEHVYADKVLSNRTTSSVQVKRIVDDIIYDFRLIKKKPFNPVQVIAEIDKFCENLPYIYLNDIQEKRQGNIPEKYTIAMKITLILIRCYLNTSFMLKNNISFEMLKLIIDKIKIIITGAMIEYGTGVGILAAQSMSEPMSQYIISSHHRSGAAGGAGDTQTDTLTRSKELLTAKSTEKMKNTSMSVFVKPEYEDDIVKVNEIANNIESMSIGRFVDNLQIFFEEYKKPVHPKYKHEVKMIMDYEDHNQNMVPPGDLINWVIRFELNKVTMILKNMDLETIIFGIHKAFPLLYVVYNFENDDFIIIRCYIRNVLFKKNYLIKQQDIEDLKDSIMNVGIRGISGVSSTFVKKTSKSIVADDGSIQSKPYYMITTTGTNLSTLLENNTLDKTKCFSNSIREIEAIYGIEAARQKMRIEFEKIVPGISQSHYTIYADEMSISGRITGINKSGLDKRESKNILLRTSYSFMTQVLKSASINGKNNKIYGMSAPLMVGRTPKVGTTYNSVIVDYDFVKKNTHNIASIVDDL